VTATVNGNRPTLTDGDDVRVCVPAHGSPLGTPEMPRERGNATYTRVIPDQPPTDQLFAETRKTVSLHVTEAGNAWRDGWLLNESKPTLAEVAALTFPAKGETLGRGVWLAMSAAGTFRTVTFAAAYLFEGAVATRIRAGVSLVLFILTIVAVAVAHLLT
jgi:hypothetical protein